MNKTFATNTHIAPVVNVSTYSGPFDYEFIWGRDEEDERSCGNFVCNDYDFGKMGELIVEEANKVFEEEKPLSQYGIVSIKATKFGSPREYNFMTDWLDIDVEVDDSFWKLAKEEIFKPENRVAIVKYASRNWISYDGFSSTMLNRISMLSRNVWAHRTYGTHMATDSEVEAALMADLDDAFDHLEHGTGDDDFREFGAILALLWIIEYTSDFDPYGDTSYGSWVTELMVESIIGNRSLSEFCTIIGPDEVKENTGTEPIFFDSFMEELERQYGEYVASGVSEASQARAKAWLETVRKDVKNRKAAQRHMIESYAPRWDNLREELDKLREEWESKLEVGWPGAWK